MLRKIRGVAGEAPAPGTRYGTMLRSKRHVGTVALMLTAILAIVCTQLPTVAQAQGARSWKDEGERVRHVVITLYKSKTFRLDQPFSTAVVGSPEIVDALPMSDRSLYIQGKKIGTTNVSVFDPMMRLIGVLDVEVTIDTGSLQEAIQASTGSRGIRVSSSNGQIVLSGQARDAVQAERAVAVARSLSPNGVVNAMSVAPSQQVLLKGRFLEASRGAGRALGVNWFVANKDGSRGVNTGQGGFVAGTPTNATPGGRPLLQTAGPLAGVTQQPFGVVLPNLVNGGTSVDVLVTALETKGLIR